jgi:hypothetical protein
MAVKKEAPKGTTGKDKLIGTAIADKFPLSSEAKRFKLTK